jgi:transcriptional regulator with XRE-family HTH domain
LKAKAQEFVRLIEQAGWSQAETARRLDLTPGAVSQICNGKTQPRQATLNLLRLILISTPRTLKRLAQPRRDRLVDWELELLNPLRALSADQRKSLLSAFGAILETVSVKQARAAATARAGKRSGSGR